jgi:hypothetical protein
LWLLVSVSHKFRVIGIEKSGFVLDADRERRSKI